MGQCTGRQVLGYAGPPFQDTHSGSSTPAAVPVRPTQPCSPGLHLCLPACLPCLPACLPTGSLQQLAGLFRSCAAIAPAAADWLLGVGLSWSVTCHVDLPQGFEGAGVSLLKAAVLSGPELAGDTLRKVVQQLVAGEQQQQLTD